MKIVILLIAIIFSYVSCYSQFGEQQIITDNAVNAEYVFAIDLDGDNDIDVLSASQGDNTIAWYENLDGQGNFGTKQIIANLYQTRYVTASDIDNDGDMDVLATSLFNNLVVWYENLDGLGNFGSQQIITTNVDLPKLAITADLDGDLDIDVITASRLDNKIAWYENLDGQGNFGEQIIITTNANTANAVFAEDIDNDGDMDVIYGAASDDKVAWFENTDGFGSFDVEHIVSTTTNGVISLFVIDVDNDLDNDIISVSFGDDTIEWFENTDGLGNFGPKQFITTEVNAPRQVYATDLDNDGDIDVIYTTHEVIDADKIVWQENDGDGNFGPQQIITNYVDGPRSVFAADLDGDGYKDVMSASIADWKIAWYKNLTYLNVDDVKLETQFIVYPNPVQEKLYIENNSGHFIKVIKVYDVLGRLILHESNPKNQLNVSNIARGILFVQLETDKGVLVKKVLKE